MFAFQLYWVPKSKWYLQVASDATRKIYRLHSWCWWNKKDFHYEWSGKKYVCNNKYYSQNFSLVVSPAFHERWHNSVKINYFDMKKIFLKPFFDCLGLLNYRLFYLANPGSPPRVFSINGLCNDLTKNILPPGKWPFK